VLEVKVEKVIAASIASFYLTRERPRFSDLMRDIEASCHSENVDPPDYRTVRRRLHDLDARKVTAARHGSKRAREMCMALPCRSNGPRIRSASSKSITVRWM
jgi:putative transposase